MNSEESTSLFGSLLGMGAAALIPGAGLLGIALGGMLGGSIFGSISSAKKQRKEQEKLLEAQRKQASILVEKSKRDSAELYSSVQSAAGQTSGAMGAVY